MAAAATAHRTTHYDTIVLGAGMSGLACASRLYQHQYFREKNHLLVLEGRDRIGGRIEAVHVNGCRLDTGANWIHGIGTDEKPNPLMGVLPHKRYRQVSGSVVFKPPEKKTQDEIERPNEQSLDGQPWIKVESVRSAQHTLGQGGGKGDRIIPKDVAGKMVGALWSMMESLHEAAAEDLGKAKDTTMLQAITASEELREAYQTVPTEYHHSIGTMPQFVESMEAAPLAAQSAESARDRRGMSLLEFGIDDFDGDQVFLQDGYVAVVEEVARELTQAGLIRLGVQVRNIDWSQNPIKLETTHGSYTASKVVCTLPLGVLQHHTQAPASGTAPIRLFVPPLPSGKLAAIDNLGFGTLDKIMLVYRTPWWTQEPYTSIFRKGLVRQPMSSGTEDSPDNSHDKASPDSLMGFTTELPGIEILEDGTTATGLGVLSIINLHNLTGFPVLSAFVSCANAVQIEAMSNEQAGGIVHRAMTSWLGREPPKPETTHVSRWAADEFSRGSYSHMITGVSGTEHRQEFQQPLVNDKGGVLRFAGEHTSRNHFATVHGALLSGWREADAILTEI
ncbi:hypothetical protein M406DRAFT_72427 [Cryphonectria parasitica EP155]|uniref:Amine oxidase domain-containing protein n=1 Tax=Cryphonectria parasitica (strain ATCC 38755 / EP155) TaxID=660469 RepID=A0A9P4XXK9_CRYP1|nr:uncharacterized protein M406DRAFT_72427 [Cryphonectria parasitica EP155]KAF3762420.1 hypothetical protein M406DRAFT_72427 [Cryphonectria parasitica EP155]